MVKAGLQAIYLSGWQVAADANLVRAGVSRPEPLPRQQRAHGGPAASTTPCGARTRSSGPRGARSSRSGSCPIVADAEAGFGGPLNAYELMQPMIEAGAAGVHLEDQLVIGEEVRAHGRQGPRAHRPAHADPRSPLASPPT